jgi:hypothetical protein
VEATVGGGRIVTGAVHRRSGVLSALDARLVGVIAPAVESVLVGGSASRAVVLGQLPDASTTVDEVRHFVGTLLEHGALLFDSARGTAVRGPDIDLSLPPTHAIRTRAGQKILKRIRFA